MRQQSERVINIYLHGKALQLTEMLMANVKDYFLRNVTLRDKFNCTIRQQ